MSESKSFSPSTPASRILPSTTMATSTSSLLVAAATKAPTEETSSTPKPKGMVESEYSPQELKDALQSMLQDSKNPDYDARHIFGHGKADHELSMLQIITATRILDYEGIMVG